MAGEDPLDYTYSWNETAQHGSQYEIDFADARVLLGREQRNLAIASGLLQPSVPYVRTSAREV